MFVTKTPLFKFITHYLKYNSVLNYVHSIIMYLRLEII